MATVKLNEMSSTPIQKIVDSLSKAYTKLINNRLSMSTFPSVMLWGQPGVGKSQAIREIANKIKENTGKEVVVTDVRLLLFNPIDLRGIPVANEDRTLAIWLKPKIFQMNPSKDVVNILFLDEISAAPQSVQSAAYQITLDRTVGEHKLPDNCIVIAAGNRVSDKSVAYKMPKALANRLLHFDVESSFESWQHWALHAGIHPMVMGFLAFRPDLLNTFDASKESLAFATPRSWEMVSNILNNVSDTMVDSYDFIAGIVGRGIATEFRSWHKTYSTLPNIKDIFDGKSPKLPSDTSAVFALVSAMLQYAKDHSKDMTRIANSIKYAEFLPKDFAIMLLQEYLTIEPGYENKLMLLPEFTRWLHNNASILNGQTNGYYK